jgi:hypothetical protein
VPGAPDGRVVGGTADGLRLITKSGGFGGPDTLITIVQRLRSAHLASEAACAQPVSAYLPQPEGRLITIPNHQPTLALTLGDVAGIGPEITAKTLLRHPKLRKICIPVVIGQAAVRLGASLAGLDPDAVQLISDPQSALNDPNTIEVIQTGDSLGDVPLGELSPRAGDGAYRFVVEACRLAGEGRVDGIVTPRSTRQPCRRAGTSGPATPSCWPRVRRPKLQPRIVRR